MHGKAWIGTIGSKCVKHKSKDQNMINKFNQGKSQNLELIGVQNNSKIPLEQFIKHLICNTILNMWAMHEHVKIYLNTCKNCHMGPAQSHTSQMGLSPIKNLKKIWSKSMFPTPFSKNPKSSEPREFSAKSKKKNEKVVKNIPWRLFCSDWTWYVVGFWVKNCLGIERGTRKAQRGKLESV